MAVEVVAGTEFSVSEFTATDQQSWDWPEAFAAAADDAVAVVAFALRTPSSGTYPTATISLGDVEATVYHYEQFAVGSGTGRSNVILALIPLAGAIDGLLFANWAALSLEVTTVVQGIVFNGVDMEALASAIASISAGQATIGPQAITNGGALVVSGGFYTGGGSSPSFQGADTTTYEMLSGLSGFNPVYYSGHQIGVGYRIASADIDETVASDWDFLPGIAYFLPALAGDAFNCSCEDTTNHRTLAQLRAEIITRLGFGTQKAATTGATLQNLRLYLLRRLGFSAQAANPPPGMTELLTEFINEAIEAVWRSYAYDVFGGTAPAALIENTDACTLDNWAVKTVALGNAKLHYGQSDGKALLEQYETYLKNLLQRTPLNLASTITSFLQDAQRQLYRSHATLRTERFYRWTMTAGERYYDLPDNEDDCGKKLDAYKITWVGVEDINGTWMPLFEGIDPTLYTGVSQRGLPARYEVRQCIEIFPAPDQAYTLRIKGHFGLESFTEDADKTTIDDQAVFLLALAQAKSHYEQLDAKNYFSQASNYIGSLVAGAHQTARYVPRSERQASIPQPRMVSWDNE